MSKSGISFMLKQAITFDDTEKTTTADSETETAVDLLSITSGFARHLRFEKTVQFVANKWRTAEV